MVVSTTDLDVSGGGCDFVSSALLLVDPSGVTEIADSAGPFRQFFGDADINDNGGIVFWASLDDGRDGIFAGADPIADQVLLTGDPLFGTQVDFVQLRDANENGDILFYYILDIHA